MLMSAIGSALNALQAAATAAANPSVSTAAGNVITALTNSHAVYTTATAQLNAFQMALLQKNSMGAALALNSLQGMQAQLPTSVGPQLALLANPDVQANPVAVAGAIAAIQSAIAQASSPSFFGL
jgi:hypothetical protein